MEFAQFKDKLTNLVGDLNYFGTEFLTEDEFKDFANSLCDKVGCYDQICITGYFSENIRKELEKLAKRNSHVRLICQEFPEKPDSRDKKNLQTLQELANSGVKIKMNIRLHARFLVAYSSQLARERDGNEWMNGQLLIGSFDFNKDCIGLERHDAGILTKYPDLVKAAVKFFDQIWNETGSVDLPKRNAQP
jgi:hypothetical protein